MIFLGWLLCVHNTVIIPATSGPLCSYSLSDLLIYGEDFHIDNPTNVCNCNYNNTGTLSRENKMKWNNLVESGAIVQTKYVVEHIVASTVGNKVKNLTELEGVLAIIDDKKTGNIDNETCNRLRRWLSIKSCYFV